MQKWEYLRVQVVYNKDGIDHVTVNGVNQLDAVPYESHAAFHQYIEDLGSQAWEMVSDSLDGNDEILYFQRSVEE